MAKVDANLRKDIVKYLHSAIDCEISNNEKGAYVHYIESLKLVAEALKKDAASSEMYLTTKERKNLIEFAKQSVGRISLILKRDEGSNAEGKENISIIAEHKNFYPTAPVSQDVIGPSIYSHFSPPKMNLQESDEEKHHLVTRYYKRLDNATSAIERQNLELELARQLVEKEAIARNRLMHATAWAMQSAHRKFNIEEKLKRGTLKESDFKKQQLFALSLQYTEGSTWLRQCLQDMSIYPNNDKLVREFLDSIFTDNAHPVRCALSNMQSKVHEIIPIEKLSNDYEGYQTHFTNVSNVVKDDLNIIQDVLKSLYESLSTDRNSMITSEVVNHFYFAPLKFPLISLIRKGWLETEQSMLRAMANGCRDSCSIEMNEDARREAITKLHYLCTLHNPYDLIDCSVHIIKLLTTSQFDKHHFTAVGADDLLPRLCNVVLQSKLVGIYAETTFMDTFMPSEKALGEEGYSVTMLQSAVAHLTQD